MNGLEIAEMAANLIGRLAPYITTGLHLGLASDPVLEAQLRGAMEIANQALIDADRRHESAMQQAFNRFDKSDSNK